MALDPLLQPSDEERELFSTLKGLLERRHREARVAGAERDLHRIKRGVRLDVLTGLAIGGAMLGAGGGGTYAVVSHFEAMQALGVLNGIPPLVAFGGALVTFVATPLQAIGDYRSEVKEARGNLERARRDIDLGTGISVEQSIEQTDRALVQAVEATEQHLIGANVDASASPFAQGVQAVALLQTGVDARREVVREAERAMQEHLSARHDPDRAYHHYLKFSAPLDSDYYRGAPSADLPGEIPASMPSLTLR